MSTVFSAFARKAILGSAVFLSACAGYGGSNLKPGVSTLPEVIAAMGEPAMRWTDADGQEQLAYPRGPQGTQTFMAFIDADGRLLRIDEVLDQQHFARIVINKSTQEDVLRLIGPSYPYWTTYYEGFDQIVWEWNFCDQWRHVARFDVYFDAPTGIVRRTEQRTWLPELPFPFGRRNVSYVECSL